MIILGIDPGLRVCGYAVVRRGFNENKMVEAGTFRTDPDLHIEFRLNQIAADIEDILKKYNPQFVAVEQLYSHYAHPRTSILMGHARGVILQKCAQLEITVKSFSATRIKKSLTGNGRATKVQMQRTVQTVLGLAALPEPPDIADAIAVALCCADSIKMAELTELIK